MLKKYLSPTQYRKIFNLKIKCNDNGKILLNKPTVCANCKGERCYLCDKNGPYTFYDDCLKCFNKSVSDVKNTDINDVNYSENFWNNMEKS